MPGDTDEHRPPASGSAWTSYATVLLLVACLTGALVALNRVFPLPTFPVPYFLLVMLVAYRFGTGPAIVAIILGWLAFAHFFVPPPGLVPVADSPRGWAAHVAFALGTSMITVAAIQWRNSSLRTRRYADETAALNAELLRQIEEREQAQEAMRESQSQFRMLFQSLPLGVVLFDPDSLNVVIFNEAASRMLGYSHDEYALLKITDVEASHGEAEIRANFSRMLDGAKLEFETRFQAKSGDVRDILINALALNVGGRKLILSIQLDITDRKQAEDRIRQMNVELEQRVSDRTSQLDFALQQERQARAALEAANKELEAFSYSVSHDLRAPLRAIDGFSNTLLTGYHDVLDERGQDYLRRVRAAAQKMGQLIDDILDLSRATRAEMREQPVDLSTLAGDILNELKADQPERSVEIDVQPGLVAEADPHLIRIALYNLLGNAWKFTSKRETARIEFGSYDKDGETVFFVRDNGAGFDQAYAEKLFSPFQRLHRETEFSGTGIGLALVSRILSRHHGRIWAESEPDKGATFYFTLGETQT
jgi:PAS domain S-box-containing protein